ncbi:MAG: acetyltransferase [Veillonellales bacterium]
MAGLLIIGAGGHGKVVADTALSMDKWDKIAFLDDRYPEITSVLNFPILGKVDEYLPFHSSYQDVVVAVGDNKLRVELIRRFIDCRFRLPLIIHPQAFVSRFSDIGHGSVVFAQAAINAGTVVGIGSIINTGATVDHECLLGCGVHVSPGVHIAGQVKIGDYTWLGIGSTIIQQRSLGRNVIVGAGAVIIQDVPNDVTTVGVPGRVLHKQYLNYV